MKLLISKISIATPLMLVCGLLTSGASSMAQSDGEAAVLSERGHRSCSNGTLSGDYGATVIGVLALPGRTVQDGAGLPIRGVVMAHFDGKGNLTQVDHIVVNGMPPPVEWTPGSGTYTVNPDCTGTAVIDTPSNPTGPLNLHFVVVKQGQEIDEVVDTNAVTAIAIKVGESSR